MPGFSRQYLKPLIGSAGLHVLVLLLLAGTALRWNSSEPPEPLAIEGVIVDESTLPREGKLIEPPPEIVESPAPPPVAREPEPEPEPVEEPPAAPSGIERAAQEEAQRQLAAERAAVERREREARERAAAEQRRIAEAKRLREEEAARKKAEEEERRRREAEEAEAKRKAEEERAALEARRRAQREADLRRQLEAEEELAALGRSGVMDDYRSLLTQTIERNWIRPASAGVGLKCELHVTQAPGGTVIDVKIGTCNGDAAVRESITNAVYRSSPLPAPGDPRLFERRLIINFEPKD